VSVTGAQHELSHKELETKCAALMKRVANLEVPYTNCLSRPIRDRWLF